jgi:hypothetical protein
MNHLTEIVEALKQYDKYEAVSGEIHLTQFKLVDFIGEVQFKVRIDLKEKYAIIGYKTEQMSFYNDTFVNMQEYAHPYSMHHDIKNIIDALNSALFFGAFEHKFGDNDV